MYRTLDRIAIPRPRTEIAEASETAHRLIFDRRQNRVLLFQPCLPPSDPILNAGRLIVVDRSRCRQHLVVDRRDCLKVRLNSVANLHAPSPHSVEARLISWPSEFDQDCIGTTLHTLHDVPSDGSLSLGRIDAHPPAP